MISCLYTSSYALQHIRDWVAPTPPAITGRTANIMSVIDTRWRLNRWFAAIVALAVLGIVSRLVFNEWYFMPRVVRHHLADFAFAALAVTVLSTLACLITPLRLYRRSSKARKVLTVIHMAFVVLAIARGVYIESQDYYGLTGDLGRRMSVIVFKWLGAKNSETFDWWDIVAYIVGGVLVGYLQWRSTRLMSDWWRFPLILRQPARDQ